MRHSTRVALQKLAEFLGDTTYDIGQPTYETEVTLPDDLKYDANLNPIPKVLKDSGFNALFRVFGAGNPVTSAKPGDLKIDPEEFKKEISEISGNTLKLTAQQFLAPQGIHQPIYAFGLLAQRLATEGANSETEKLADQALAQANLPGFAPSGGEWLKLQESMREAAGRGVTDNLTSLAGGFKICDHGMFLEQMKSIRGMDLVADNIRESQPTAPSKNAPTYGYVAFVDPMQSYCKIESEICGVGNTLIPPLEWSRAIPFIDVKVLSTYDFTGPEGDAGHVKSRLSPMSLDHFLRSGFKSPISDYEINGLTDEQPTITPILTETGKNVLDPDGNPLMRSKGVTSAGMEAFTLPQTIIPAGQGSDDYATDTNYYTSVDRMRPFMSIDNLAVQVTPTRGASSTVRATLTLTLHDRGRLEQIGSLLRPETLSETEFDIEWGWSHPARENGSDSENVYGMFINSMRQRQKFNLYQSNYAFTEDGQVQITLSMVSKGMETLNETDSAMTGRFEESWKSVNQAYKALEVARDVCKSVDGFDRYAKSVKDLEGMNMINTLDLNSTGMLISVDNRKAIQEWITGAKKLRGTVPELGDLIKSLNILKKAVEEADHSLKEDLNAKLALINKKRYKDWGMYVKGMLPEKAAKGDYLYNPKNTALPSNWKNRTGSNSGYVPLGAFLQMFVVQPLMASGQYDEVQLITYTANLHAGAAAGANLGALPIHVGATKSGGTRETKAKTFKQILEEQYTTYGGQYPISRFIQWLVSNYIEPQLAPCHGFGPGASKFKYDPSAGAPVPVDAATEALAKNAAKNLRKMYYGSEAKGTKYTPRPTSFSPIKLKILYEVAPASSAELVRMGVTADAAAPVEDLTVLRIHVLDAVAEGAEGMGWVDVLKQGRSSVGSEIIPPEDSLTPGMTPITKLAANWDQNRMTTRRVAQLLTGLGILDTGTKAASEEDKQNFAAAQEDLKKRYEEELAAIDNALDRYNRMGEGLYENEKQILNDKKAAINAALNGDKTLMEFSVGYKLRTGSSKRMIKLCSSMAPNIVYGQEGSLVNQLNIKQRSNSKAATTYMMRALNAGSGGPGGVQRGTPMRLQSADINIDMFGNPALKYMQRFFIDADTNTTIDNLYAVTGVDHKLSKDSYTTSLRMVPLEAYGAFQNLATDVDRITSILDGLRTASNRRNHDINVSRSRARAARMGEVLLGQTEGIKNFAGWYTEMSRFIRVSCEHITTAYCIALATYGHLVAGEGVDIDEDADEAFRAGHRRGMRNPDVRNWQDCQGSAWIKEGLKKFGQAQRDWYFNHRMLYIPSDDIPGKYATAPGLLHSEDHGIESSFKRSLMSMPIAAMDTAQGDRLAEVTPINNEAFLSSTAKGGGISDDYQVYAPNVEPNMSQGTYVDFYTAENVGTVSRDYGAGIQAYDQAQEDFAQMFKGRFAAAHFCYHAFVEHIDNIRTTPKNYWASKPPGMKWSDVATNFMTLLDSFQDQGWVPRLQRDGNRMFMGAGSSNLIYQTRDHQDVYTDDSAVAVAYHLKDSRSKHLFTRVLKDRTVPGGGEKFLKDNSNDVVENCMVSRIPTPFGLYNDTLKIKSYTHWAFGVDVECVDYENFPTHIKGRGTVFTEGCEANSRDFTPNSQPETSANVFMEGGQRQMKVGYYNWDMAYPFRGLKVQLNKIPGLKETMIGADKVYPPGDGVGLPKTQENITRITTSTFAPATWTSMGLLQKWANDIRLKEAGELAEFEGNIPGYYLPPE